jgi:hypothetical protein
MNSLNSSRLETLSLTENKRLLPASLTRLLDLLNAPHLHELHLSICNIGPELAEPVIRLLRSERSRSLELLGLNGNNLGHEAVRDIIDAVEEGCFTIRNLGLYANHPRLPAQGEEDEEEASIARTIVTATLESKRLGEETERIPPLLERNRLLTQRVQRAALRCLPCARILLNAQPLSDLENARMAIESISINQHTPYFRLLDLPPEVLYLIVRHTSSDAIALSDAQYTRLRKDAEGGEGLRKAVRMAQSKTKGWVSDESTQRALSMELRDEWLRSGRWDKWERDTKIRAQ